MVNYHMLFELTEKLALELPIPLHSDPNTCAQSVPSTHNLVTCNSSPSVSLASKDTCTHMQILAYPHIHD
ncbi:mCG148194 [Mus musculus]|nr:mCG148194 [Mus musculus]